jgi:uncharacterized membrane protein
LLLRLPDPAMPSFPLTPVAFSGEPRIAPPDSAFNWLRQGWAAFAVNPGLWLAATIMLIAGFLALHLVPLVGGMTANLLLPLLTAGVLHALKRCGDEATFALDDLLAGFRRNTGPLVIVGLIYMAGWLAIDLVVKLLIGGSLAGGALLGAAGQPLLGAGVGLGGVLAGGVLALILATPLLLAVSFAPALVYFNDMPPVAALKASFSANLKNWLVMTVFGLIVLVLCFFAALPMGLGFVVLIPVLYGALYAAYKDIFLG